jgi:hypothetical protein
VFYPFLLFLDHLDLHALLYLAHPFLLLRLIIQLANLLICTQFSFFAPSLVNKLVQDLGVDVDAADDKGMSKLLSNYLNLFIMYHDNVF